jgi:hypothetical protein
MFIEIENRWSDCAYNYAGLSFLFDKIRQQSDNYGRNSIPDFVKFWIYFWTISFDVNKELDYSQELMLGDVIIISYQEEYPSWDTVGLRQNLRIKHQNYESIWGGTISSKQQSEEPGDKGKQWNNPRILHQINTSTKWESRTILFDLK